MIWNQFRFQKCQHKILYKSQAESFIKANKKEDKSVVMTLRIDRELQEEFDILASKSDHSRNELMCMALRYVLDRKRQIR